MLHPVLPPAPPVFVEPIQPANSASSASDRQLQLAGNIDIQSENQQELTKLDQKQPSSTKLEKTQDTVKASTPTSHQTDNFAATPVFSSPSQPETFSPEFSPLTNSHSAVHLGAPLAIGYPVQQKTDADFTATSESIHTFKLTPQPGLVASSFNKQEEKEQITLQKTGNGINISASKATDPQATNQPVQNLIEFKSRNSLNNFSVSQQVPSSTPTPTQPSVAPRQRIVEVNADKQEYDEQRRIVTAEGNVVVRFDGAVLTGDRLQVNLDNLIAAGEGNVVLTRGDQILRGQKFTYNFVQDSGQLENGRGEINIPTASADFAFLPTDVTTGGVPRKPPSDRILANQPLSQVSSPGGIEFSTGGTADASNLARPRSGGKINRVRFEAQQIEFYPRGWQARNVRLTNDPFSPPELELRANKVTLTREAPLVDRVNTQGQSLVFDQGLTLGIPVSEQKIDRREREATPFIFSPGFDGDKRGGLYIQRSFTPISTDNTSLQITPQFFVQKAVQGSDPTDMFGITARLRSVLSSRSVVEGFGELTSFNFDNIDNNLKASLRLRQALSDRNPYIVNWEYSYRDRLYNGTLGFQTVQSSLGGIITSPVIPLGKTGINLSYQAGLQYINANTDRLDLLDPVRKNDRISLGRFQGSAALSKGFFLWQGKPLPPTATGGLRYTPNPVVPYLLAVVGLTGTSSYYTNGDNQSNLIATVGLSGQIGNFSRPFLDYTAFNISYSQGLTSGLSPFLFDRYVDTKVLTAGITQQIYGPFRIGFQTSVNLDTGRESSTDYILDYSRRTYGITLRYNPVLELGAFSIRISDFNWVGGTDPFSNDEIRPVVGGVTR